MRLSGVGRLPSLPWLARSLKTAVSSSQPESGRVTTTTLPNGMRVASEDSPGHMAALCVAVDVGSRYEDETNSGMTHLLERLAFRSFGGDSERISEELVRMGGNVVCSGARENILYGAGVFRNDLPGMVQILSRVARQPHVDPGEMDMLREVMERDYLFMFSKPETLLPELIHSVAYRNNTLGHPLICQEGSIAKLSPEIVRTFVEQWFQPSRVVFSGVGIEHDHLADLVHQHFGDWKSRPVDPQVVARLAEPALYTGGQIRINELNQTYVHVSLGFEGVSFFDDDFYAASILASMMGGGSSFSAGGPGKGMYSRLYTNVLNQYYWVESAQSYILSYKDSGIFGLSGSAPPAHASQLIDVLCVEFLKTVSITEGAELSRAKNQLKSSVLMHLEMTINKCEDIARQVQMFGHYLSGRALCARIDAITAEDVRRVALRFLSSKLSMVSFGDLQDVPNVETVQARYFGGSVQKKVARRVQ